MSIIIKRPDLCTSLKIWHPRYSDKWQDEPRVLLSKTKVHHASPIILVEFTKAKSLIGLRFAIHRNTVEQCSLGTNGKIAVYEVPLSLFEGWESNREIFNLIDSFGWN